MENGLPGQPTQHPFSFLLEREKRILLNLALLLRKERTMELKEHGMEKAVKEKHKIKMEENLISPYAFPPSLFSATVCGQELEFVKCLINT